MTSEELAAVLLANNKTKAATLSLNCLIAALVRFNNILVECSGFPPEPGEPLTNEILAQAALTADLYLVRNLLKSDTPKIKRKSPCTKTK